MSTEPERQNQYPQPETGECMHTPDEQSPNTHEAESTNTDPGPTNGSTNGGVNGRVRRPLQGRRASTPEEIPRPRALIGTTDPTDSEAPETESEEDEVSPIEGELVSEADSAALDRRLARQVAARAASRATGWVRTVPPAQAARVVRIVRESDKPATASKATLRHSLTVAQGLESWARRAWDAGTLGVYRRQIKAAEACGDRDALQDWTERKEHATERRHRRLMDLPALAAGVAKVAVGSVAALVGLVLAIGIFVQVSGKGEFTSVITGVLDAVRWIFTAIAVAWTPFIMALPAGLLFAAWREGKRRGRAPAWLATTAEADQDAPIDETTIATALDALRVPQISAYLKQGFALQYLTPCREAGRGTHAIIRLPAGVTAEKIEKRRGDLATGLRRLSKEVWPTTGAEAGILDLWVADKGALEEGAGPYPLLERGTVDVFTGVPFGKTLRGDPLTAPLMGRNTLTGGMPGQGKSSAARALMAGAALDPSVELRIWVPDANFDFEAFRPRCSRYVMGAEDEHIADILAQLRELHAEVQRRGEKLIQVEEPAVTRDLADKNLGLHPLVCLLEEAHVAIQHPTHGKDIAKLLVDIVRLGRKRGIHLIVSTQAPTKDSMPRDVTRNCSNGIAFAVGDHVANDALLGQGAYRGGHRATDLIPGTDIGTAIVKGFTGERSDIVQIYYLNISRDHDHITPIITRAIAALATRGSGTVPGVRNQEPQPDRDLLQDLHTVLGDEPVPAADVPALLANHAPGWAPYKRLTGKALRSVLADEYGITVPSTGNRYPVDPVTVRNTLAERTNRESDADD